MAFISRANVNEINTFLLSVFLMLPLVRVKFFGNELLLHAKEKNFFAFLSKLMALLPRHAPCHYTLAFICIKFRFLILLMALFGLWLLYFLIDTEYWLKGTTKIANYWLKCHKIAKNCFNLSLSLEYSPKKSLFLLTSATDCSKRFCHIPYELFRCRRRCADCEWVKWKWMEREKLFFYFIKIASVCN